MKTGLRILVVDDEETIRGVLSQVLEEEGHEVTSAASGEEGLEFYKADPFPVVITDINLGGMDGIQLLQEIRKIDPDTLVVIITSYASMETSVKALRHGAYDYLFKPFEDLDLVTSVVERAVERIRLLRVGKWRFGMGSPVCTTTGTSRMLWQRSWHAENATDESFPFCSWTWIFSSGTTT
jgi:DNA-binding NtrC family response regulator